jgi:putative transposase
MAGARRWVYNWALARRIASYKATGKSVPWSDLSKELTALKRQPDTIWLKEGDSQLLQQALADIQRAFCNFFEGRAKFPRFKSKKDTTQSFRIPQRVTLHEGKVYIPKIGGMKIRQTQAVEVPIKSATFKRDACGMWFVTLVTEFSLPPLPLPSVSHDQVVGVDVGLSSFLTTSEGQKIDAPRFFRKAEKKLRRAQRSLSRKQKGTRNRARAKNIVARVHRRIANQRADFCHKLSTGLVRRFSAICCESLSLKGLARTKLAKSALDAAHGMLLRQIEYKARWHHRHAVFVDRWFPSSQLCSVCSYQYTALSLSERTWTCPECGTSHDRDTNAARNLKREGLRLLLAAGHAESKNACGGDVSHAPHAVSAETRIPAL